MNTSQERIFVQIASYCDRECQWTIRDLFEKASDPDRIFVGVCWQLVPDEDADCFQIETRPRQVRTARYHARESKGLGWARQKALDLWAGEEFLLQIDSHMRFVEGWDQKMLDMLARTDSKWPVLTVYPPSYTPPDNLEETPPLRIQNPDSFNEEGILTFSAAYVPSYAATDRPFPTSGLAGGFVFGSSRIIELVKPDPCIYFFGEEVSLAVRMWTHGFDLYSPNEHLIYHYYMRKGSKRHWKDNSQWHDYQVRSLARVRQMLEPSNNETFREVQDLGQYGLGAERTLAEYEQFSGVNFAGKTIARHARRYPYVLTQEVASSILAQPDLRLVSTAHLFIVEDQGIVFSEDTGDFSLLNPAATYAWCRLEDGASTADLAEDIERILGETRTRAETMVAGILTHWQGLGLLETSEDFAIVPPLKTTDEAPPASAHGVPACPEAEACTASHYYRLLGSTMVVRYATATHKQWVHPVLAHLEVEPGEAVSVITTAEAGDVIQMYVDAAATDQCREIDELAPLVKFKLQSIACREHDHILNLHAGAVSNGESCILFPASAGSGKTSLTAALIATGYTYFSDETALLERDGCYVRPVPLSMTVKSTGTDILTKLYPALPDLPLHSRADGKRVRYLRPPEHALHLSASPMPVSTIVFPRYQPGAVSSLRRLSTVDALGRLLEHCVSYSPQITPHDAETLIRWVGTVNCYDMTHDSFDSALPLLSRAMTST